MKGFSFNHKAITKDGGKRRIRISATHAFAVYVLQDYLLSYNKLNPSLVFEVITDDYLIDLFINDVDMTIRPFDPNLIEAQQECFIV